MTTTWNQFLPGYQSRFPITPFKPLTVSDFRSLTQTTILEDIGDDQLQRLWIDPVQLKLQQEFKIDQRKYSATTIPTLAELEEAFRIATIITIDKMSLNPEDASGPERVQGSFRFWNHRTPERAAILLERFRTSISQIGRA